MSRFVVGLTGGIGSGKTAVSDRFAARGVNVVDGDLASRAVLAPGSDALARVAEHFGSAVLNADGSLNRADLRARVFADAAERQWLEALTHPLIRQWLSARLAEGEAPYSMLVNPILVESGQSGRCDRVLVVDAPPAVQLARTMARDGNSEDQVRAIMAAQVDRDTRLAAADDVIVNDQGLEHLDAEVARLHGAYLELANHE